jgi:porphobilinogen deaminase
MKALGGGCKRALAALAEVGPTSVRVRGAVGDPRQGRVVRRLWEGPIAGSEAAMDELARGLLEDAALAGLDADA